MPVPLKMEYEPRSGIPAGVGAGAVVVAAVLVVMGDGDVVVAWSAMQMFSVMKHVCICINGSPRKARSLHSWDGRSGTCWTQVVPRHVRLQSHVPKGGGDPANVERDGAIAPIGRVQRRPNSKRGRHHSDHI